MKKFKLLKDWRENKAGAVVEVDEATGKTLVETGYAAEVATSATVEEQMAAALTTLKTEAKKVFAGAIQEAVKELSVSSDGSSINVEFVKDRREDDPRCGFKSLGEFAKSVVAFDTKQGVDERIKVLLAAEAKAPTGMSEMDGSSAGILIPPQFANGIWARATSVSDIVGRCDTYNITSNSFVALKETGDTQAAGTRNAGVRGYWLEEGQQGTSSKPSFKRDTLRLKKMMVLVYATDELLSDSPMAMEQYLTRKAGDEMAFMIGDALINGDGVGKPMGVLKSACLVSVAKETGQAADTVVTENIVKAYSRMYAPSRAKAAWFHNQDCEPQLFTLTIAVGTGGSSLVIPPGGISNAPNPSMFGKPMIATPWNPTVGDAGDVLLADWSQYLLITKGGVNSSVSIHLRFDYDETVFKFTYRIDGQPWWSAALTPFKSALTQSPFVVLAAR